MQGHLSPTEISDLLEISDPFLMIDGFDLIEEGKSGRGTKVLAEDDWYFRCHLPSVQAMPATLLIEGMLQSMVSLIYMTVDHGANRSFVTDIQTKLSSGGAPGMKMTYDAELISFRRGIAKGEVTGSSNEKLICWGAFSYASPHLMVAPKPR